MKNVFRTLWIMAVIVVITVCLSSCIDISIHSHSFESVWSHDDAYHWHKATCKHDTEIFEKGEHLFGEDHICSVCGMKDSNVKYTVNWVDSDGTILQSDIVASVDDIVERRLPYSSPKWVYDSWEKTVTNDVYTYTAVRHINDTYFIGNVFQIVTKDLGGEPKKLGSGFVFNKEGWFITNAHVLGDAYYATAIFDIENTKLGEAYTYLDIDTAIYKNDDKDIFIGKINNYKSLQYYYNNIGLSTNHVTDETTYSVGYPDSSCELKINEGKSLDDFSRLKDKLYSGVKYIGSNSYIAPGSSGGILVNANLEVIGITTLGYTDENDEFVYGASIATPYFMTHLKGVEKCEPISLQMLNHEDEQSFINMFIGAKEDGGFKQINDDGVVAYVFSQEYTSKTESGKDVLKKHEFAVYSNKYISLSEEYYWSNGDHRTIQLYGFYSVDKGIDSLKFTFEYHWNDAEYYSIKCDDINYNTNVSLTLTKAYVNASRYYTVSQSNIKYAKEDFNYLYESLMEWIRICNEYYTQ